MTSTDTAERGIKWLHALFLHDEEVSFEPINIGGLPIFRIIGLHRIFRTQGWWTGTLISPECLFDRGNIWNTNIGIFQSRASNTHEESMQSLGGIIS